jgi:hypothetical protein
MRRLTLGTLTLFCTLSVAVPAVAQTQATRVRIDFVPQSDSFTAAAQEYERIWREHGPRMVEAMERRAALRFVYPQYADTAIRSVVLERASSSGHRDRSPMEMRASYPEATKRATLIHELGHRLMSGLFRRDEGEHEMLFLWVYDVWIDLYGQQFADEQVAIEKQRGGPYPAAWDAVTALTPAGRAARWQGVLRERLPTRR